MEGIDIRNKIHLIMFIQQASMFKSHLVPLGTIVNVQLGQSIGLHHTYHTHMSHNTLNPTNCKKNEGEVRG
jgi:hypothetical protein